MTFLKKILLVDYEPHVTTLVRRALESTGKYVIKEEHNARQAMNAARWFQPDLILFDVVMSHPEGEAIARQLQADASFKDTPVMFLGVNTAPEGAVMSGGILSGYSFFANPVRIEDFVRYVGEMLNPTASAKAARTPKREAVDALSA
jgi:DNA-binding response OmpR family regulator